MSRIVGYLDARTDRELIGWIANLDHPGRLETVICNGEDGRQLAFRPFIPRRDVCDAFNVTGRFGFAIPLAALSEFGGGVVRLTDSLGATLPQGGAIAVDAGAGGRPLGPAWVVLHIQKTAGTSLRAALTAHARPCETLFLYPDGFTGLSPDELGNLPQAQRAALRLVIGHVPFGIADLLPGRADYVTFLRDPAARLESHYLHHLAIDAGPDLTGSSRVAATVTGGLSDEFDNLMVRMIAGVGVDTVPLGTVSEAEVERALHHIRTRFRFVGLTERLTAHYRVLAGLMGLSADVPPVENTCRVADRATALAQVDWHQVMHRNRFDAMLYRRVQEEGLCGRDLGAIPHLVRTGKGRRVKGR